jgi:enoyl-CoA hydratase
VLERDDVDVDRVPVAVLRMAHGPVNAMDVELCQALAERFRGLAADPVRAVVLTGSERAFSAGVDLKRCLAEGEAYVPRWSAPRGCVAAPVERPLRAPSPHFAHGPPCAE